MDTYPVGDTFICLSVFLPTNDIQDIDIWRWPKKQCIHYTKNNIEFSLTGLSSEFFLL